MNSKNTKIELPFEIASLLKDLKEIKQYLSEVDDTTSEEFADEITLLKGVIENLEEIIKDAKNPDKMDLRTKISLLAHFTLFQELMAAWDEGDFDDDLFDECDEDECDEDSDESEIEMEDPIKR
jgi:hypothetical protein